ncbi:cytochrome-c peroxidase [Massilia sp. TSP1-1-2]|uniref:cytochrome-c peroxidase n=1 Tax=Massilia sp. TSP1-1-2 TaxID=2804649 RepID=UPI003CF9EAA1
MSSTLRFALCILGRLGLFGMLATGEALAQPLLGEPIRPLPQASGANPARAALGRALFYDLRLSRDNNQSCASCHQLHRGGADTRALSLGAGGVANRFNTPTVYNSTFNFRQTWTGRHNTIDGLLEHVISRPTGLASSWVMVASRLTGDEAMTKQFQAVYGAEAKAENLKDALGHYLKSLNTPSRFDRYLRGERAAISVDEKNGYAKFKSFGCVSCHQGINVGGNMYQRFGAMREPAAGALIAADQGRFELTGREADRRMLRVPSLRNVALTAPYFHNGSVATLDEAVDAMFKYQLGRDASSADKALIVAFLKTLNGEVLPPRGAAP